MPSNAGSRPFSLLIKPASADCNLTCNYCFYLKKSELYPGAGRHRMSYPVLEQVISSYMKTRQPVYSFGWQGGEPALMGLSFFEKVVELQEAYGSPGAVVSNGLQTNATLIDDSLAAHFARYRFLLGVSIDGPERFHDQYRKYGRGSGSYREMRKGVEKLRKHGVEFNALVLVSSANVGKPRAVYNHLKELGIRHHQYIPCVEFDKTGKPLPWTITGREWGSFLKSIYSLWVPDDIRRVSVRNFDAILQLMVNNKIIMCTLGRNCTQYFVVEYNGDVYPCDFFVEEELKIGNVQEDSWAEMSGSREYRSFGRKKCEWDSQCGRCDYLSFCAGDCLKHRWYGDRDHKNRSWLCEGISDFYSTVLPGFSSIASGLSG